MPVYKLQEHNPVDYAVLPADAVVGVEVEEITPKIVPGKNGKADWTKLEFKFVIDSIPTSLQAEYGDLNGTRIWGSVGETFSAHPENKLRQWAECLLGLGELPPGFELDTDMLIGRRARGVVSLYDKRDGSKAHQIMGLLPSGSTLSSTTTPAVQAVAIDYDEPPF